MQSTSYNETQSTTASSIQAAFTQGSADPSLSTFSCGGEGERRDREREGKEKGERQAVGQGEGEREGEKSFSFFHTLLFNESYI